MTSLRTKLTVLVAVPLAILVVVAALGVKSASTANGRAGEAVDLLRVAITADNAALALVQERHLSTKPTDSDALEAQRAQSDEAVDLLVSQLSSRRDRLGPGRQLDVAKVEKVEKALGNLPGVRTSVDQLAAEERPADRSLADQSAIEADVLRRYSLIIDPVSALDQVFQDSSDPTAFRQLQAHRALVRAIDGVALQEGVLTGVFEDGAITQAAQRELTDVVASERLWIERFQESASSSQLDAYAQLVSTPSVTTAERLLDGTLAVGPSAPLEGNAAVWSTAMDKKIDLLVDFAAGSAGDLEGALDGRNGAAGQGLLRAIGYLFAALAASALALLALHRLAISPIQRLGGATQATAEDVAQAVASGEIGTDPEATLPLSLPEPVDDELSDVVDAFNTLQDTTVALSAERTALRDEVHEVFLNFGRRAQNLVTRQLGQIDDLETRTDDPDMLADLFVLDHLATKLRRNAESMVVLAGSSSPRAWARPVSIVNVVRAAAAEAVDYSRVDVVHMATGSVTGATANDVSHLMAELIDNALTYSPPESRVAIAGERHPDGRYLVAISDAGMGMSPTQLEEANARLSGSPGSTQQEDEPLSKHFGLYVVSQLAQRHGIAVRLVPSHLNGIRAEVALPRAMMVLPTDARGPALQRSRQTGETALTDGRPATSAPYQHARRPMPSPSGPVSTAYPLTGPSSSEHRIPSPPPSSEHRIPSPPPSSEHRIPAPPPSSEHRIPRLPSSEHRITGPPLSSEHPVTGAPIAMPAADSQDERS